MKLLRTLLFTPGNNMRMIEKVCKLSADAIIFDLEDAVPMPDKQSARSLVRDSLKMAADGLRCILVRVNSMDTELLEGDLEFIVQPGLDGIMLPKSEGPEEIEKLSMMLSRFEKDRGMEEGRLCIVPLVETAKGVMNVYRIALACSRVAAIALGGVDFSRDMGVTLTKEGGELSYPRAQIAIAARAAGVLAVDTPCIHVRDDEQLRHEALTAKQYGFSGKLLIHPSQIDIVNEMYSPSEEQVEYAREVVEAFDRAQNQGLGAVSLKGKMIDAANYRQAKDVLAAYEVIRQRVSAE